MVRIERLLARNTHCQVPQDRDHVGPHKTDAEVCMPSLQIMLTDTKTCLNWGKYCTEDSTVVLYLILYTGCFTTLGHNCRR